MSDITSRLADLSPEMHRVLALKLKQKAAATAAAASAGRGGERPSEFPASFAQRRMWLLDRLEPGSTAYSMPRVWRIPGPLDAAALERAVDELARRHETLRTRLEERGEEPVQVVAPPAPFRLEVTDLSALAPDEARAGLERLAHADASAPFRLEEGPLFRASLVRLAADDHALLWNLHHAVTDGWSTGILERELKALYGAFSRGEPSPLAPLPLQYGDHALRERQRLSGDTLERLVGWWRDALEGAPTRLEMAPDRPRPAVRTHRGAAVSASLGAGLAARVDALARAHDATPFMVYLAAFQLLLGRYAHQDDVLVGTAVANRASADVEGIVGFFVNTLVLRGDLTGEPTFAELLGRVREATLGAFEHQALPFEKLVEELNPGRSLSHAPLVQAVIVLHNQHGIGGGRAAAPGAAASALRLEATAGAEEAARFDLGLDLEQGPDGVHARLSYATDFLEEATVRRMLGHFGTLLDAAVRAPETALSALPLIGDAERALVVEEWNRTEAEYPADRCVHQLFEAQAARTPGAVAVVLGGAELTYAELDARANRLARHLAGRGVGVESRVGVLMEPAADRIVSILAILKAGGAYVPLDPRYPAERLAFMLDDSAAGVLLTQESLRSTLPVPGDVEVVSIDGAAAEIRGESAGAPASGAAARTLAYVIYTSGSTGTPKGVGVEHRSVVRLVRGADYADFGPDAVVLQGAPVSFDASTLEIWAPLLNGGRVVMPEADPSLEELGRTIVRQGVTTLWLTASLFGVMVRERLEELGGVRQLLAGGDVLPVEQVRALKQRFPGVRLINGYGPTENTTFTCCYTVPNGWSGSSVPIGRPISNTRVYVLDRVLRPVPVGVPGELFAAGDGVARGYLGHPGRTAERFVPDPFATEPGARMYRTGDRVRWREERAEVRECVSAEVGSGSADFRTDALTHSRTGVLEYLGRLDRQIKLRGFRIEPGEVEAALAAHAAVREALVVAREDRPGDRRLVAYVVGETSAGAEVLRAHLHGTLPEYMVPAAYVRLDAFPLTANGKLDRKALPAPEGEAYAHRGYVAPATPLELRLVNLWEEVLGVRPVGTADNFFDLGGNSLLGARVVGRVREMFGCEIPLSTLIAGGTVADFAAVVAGKAEPGPRPAVVAIQPAGSRPPVFLVHAVSGEILLYVALARHLGADQPVYGIQDPWLDGIEPAFIPMEETAARYVAEMRRVQPSGPYHLGGYSFGGAVVFEMARQLEAAGETVAFLGVLDTSAPVTRRWSGESAAGEEVRVEVCDMWKLVHDKAVYHGRALPDVGDISGFTYDQHLEAALRHLKELGLADAGAGPEAVLFPSLLRHMRERVLGAYQAGTYGGPLTLFRTDDLAERGAGEGEAVEPKRAGGARPPALGWDQVCTSPVEIIPIPGSHLTLTAEPHVGPIAALWRRCLDRVWTGAAPRAVHPRP